MPPRIIEGDALSTLQTVPAQSAQMCVTSPPYFGLRDYGHAGQMGLEATPDEYVAAMVAVFSEVRRVLKDDGTLWLNIGDSYSSGPSGGLGGSTLGGGQTNQRHSNRSGVVRDYGIPPKNLIGVPWMLAFALRRDGWYLRSDIIWHKPNPMPESVTDRPTKSHEYLFLLAKSERYLYNAEAIAEQATGGECGNTVAVKGADQSQMRTRGNLHRIPARETRNRRTVWTVVTQPFSGAHFATFPPALIEPCILAGSNRGDVVLDPFGGAGTTALVADRLGRDSLLIELNPTYAALARDRVLADNPLGLAL